MFVAAKGINDYKYINVNVDNLVFTVEAEGK